MRTVTLRISDDLAERLQPYQDEIERILQLGLQHVEMIERSDATLREQMLAAIRSTGLIQPLDEDTVGKYLGNIQEDSRQKPLEIEGTPVSDLIIEQRGPR